MKFKNLKFKKFINLLCFIHLINETKLKSCYNTDFESFLISSKTVNTHYFVAEIFEMKLSKNRRKKKFDLWIKISVRNVTIKKNFVIMKKDFHIMPKLFCFVILKTNFMKLFDITFMWGKKKDWNMIIIQNIYQIEIKVTRIQFLLTRSIDIFVNFFTNSIIMRKIAIKSSWKKKTNVYVKKFVTLNFSKKKNVTVKHKSFVTKNYIFEFVQKFDFSLSQCFLKIHIVVENDCDSISIINFEKN